MIKINLAINKIKNLYYQPHLFWQMIIVCFFVGLSLALVVILIFWFKLEKDLNITTQLSVNSSESLNRKNLNQTLDQIKKRINNEGVDLDLNSSFFVDPGR